MRKPKPPKSGGLQAQKNYSKRLTDYGDWKRLKERNRIKAGKL